MSRLLRGSRKATDDLAESDQRIYDECLRELLEPEHDDEFVAMNSEPKRDFLGPTGLNALRAGRGH